MIRISLPKLASEGSASGKQLQTLTALPISILIPLIPLPKPLILFLEPWINFPTPHSNIDLHSRLSMRHQNDLKWTVGMKDTGHMGEERNLKNFSRG